MCRKSLAQKAANQQCHGWCRFWWLSLESTTFSYYSYALFILHWLYSSFTNIPYHSTALLIIHKLWFSFKEMNQIYKILAAFGKTLHYNWSYRRNVYKLQTYSIIYTHNISRFHYKITQVLKLIPLRSCAIPRSDICSGTNTLIEEINPSEGFNLPILTATISSFKFNFYAKYWKNWSQGKVIYCIMYAH